MHLTDVLTKLDPKAIERFFPTKADKNRYEAAKTLVNGVLTRAESGRVSPEFIPEIENATATMFELYSSLSQRTELASKARLNEAVFWAEAGHVERSIYLAGVARERRLKEPYRTQLSVLPAHACFSRYLQLNRVDAWMNAKCKKCESNDWTDPECKSCGNIQAIDEEVKIELARMKQSYLFQLNYFSTDAYIENRNQPYAGYMRLITVLLMACEYRKSGQETVAGEYDAVAERISSELAEPMEDSHYMELTYHKKNYDEFTKLQDLAKIYKEIGSRLEFLRDKAVAIDSRGGGVRPKDYFDFGPYVTFCLRTASVFSILCLVPPVFGVSVEDVRPAFDHTWDLMTEQVLSVSPGETSSIVADPPISAAHTEGLAAKELESLASIAKETNISDYFLHTGGIAANVGTFGIHTGGIA